MPTLNWIGKEAVVGHHKKAPFRLLQCNPKLSVGDPGSGGKCRFAMPTARGWSAIDDALRR